MKNSKKMSWLILVLGILAGCNKEPYMPKNPPTYIGHSAATHGSNNDKQPVLSALKVMTYNIHAGEPTYNEDTTDLGVMVKAIRQGDPDILFLQEVDKGTNRNGFLGDQAAILGDSLKMNYFFFSARQHLRGLYGVAILSKYPLKEIRKYDLTKESDATEQRVMGAAVIDLPGVDSVLAAVTHLQHNSATNRVQQVKDIVNILGNKAERTIIGGDFNEFETTTDFFSVFDGLFTRTCKGGNCPGTFTARNPVSVIDYLAYKPAAAFSVNYHRTIDAQNASDHLPVVAELKINR